MWVCMCVYHYSRHSLPFQVYSVLGCLTSCGRFGARGLLSPWERFQRQEQKADQEGVCSYDVTSNQDVSLCVCRMK